MTLRVRTAAIAATTAALLLTGCGGSDDSSDDPLPGLGQDNPQGEEEPDEAADDPVKEEVADGRPVIELPDDVELVFDWDAPEDAGDAAAAGDAQQFMLAITKGIVEQDPEHSIYLGYSLEGARDYGRTQISAWVDGGWTKSGSDRYYRLTTERMNDTVRVSFCRDNADMYGKEVSSGEIVPKEDKDAYANYSYYSINMWAVPGEENAYVARQVAVDGDAGTCAE